MSKSIPKPALGLLNGLKIIGRPDFFPQYGIELLDEPCPVINHFLTIKVTITTSRIHYFYPVRKKDVNNLCETLSRVKQTDVRLMGGTIPQILKGWHRGQVVIGQRSLDYFVPGISRSVNARSKF